MATTTTPKMTAEEFGIWWCQEANRNQRFELVKGDLVACPLPPLNPARLPAAQMLMDYIWGRGRGVLRMFDDGLIVRRQPDCVLSPDLMLYLNPRVEPDFPPRVTDECPELVVECLTDSISQHAMIRRGSEYLRCAGFPLLWFVFAEQREVFVCRLKSSIEIYEADDELTGSGVLPDFRCRVADLFALPGTPPAPTASPAPTPEE